MKKINNTNLIIKSNKLNKFEKHNRLVYKNFAKIQKKSLKSTINDLKVRNLEIKKISEYVTDKNIRILECGCGNGSVSNFLSSKFKVKIDAFDSVKEFIKVANLFKKKNKLVNYFVNDIGNITLKKKYDLVFTIRVLQNLPERKKYTAIKEVYKKLSKNGHALFIETTSKSHNNLNKIRKSMGLDEIQIQNYNILLNEKKIIAYAKKVGFRLLKVDNFLSTYYFWSRGILPLILKDSKKIKSDHPANDYFVEMPPIGDFGGHKLFVFKK